MPFLPQPSQFILVWDRHRNMLDCIPLWLVRLYPQITFLSININSKCSYLHWKKLQITKVITDCYGLLPRCTNNRWSDNGTRHVQGRTQLNEQSLGNCFCVRVSVGTRSNHRLCQHLNDVITHPPDETQWHSIIIHLTDRQTEPNTLLNMCHPSVWH